MDPQREPTTIIITDGRMWKSISASIFAIVTMLSMVGIGVVIDSAAIQWIAAILWLLVIIGTAVKSEYTKRMTIDQAREYLDELESAEPKAKDQAGPGTSDHNPIVRDPDNGRSMR